MATLRKPRMSPKDFFLYLAAAVTLYLSAGSLIRLLFEIIDATFPDRLDVVFGIYASGALRFAIASLIIIFPLYLLLSWLIRKDIVKDTSKYELSIRKWFIYFTLFLGGGVIVGDLIALVNTFLNGEITTRFILKAVAVFVVAGAVFLYYVYDLRRAKRGDTTVRISLVWVSGLAVLAAIVSGFYLMGTPSEQRDFRFDEERVSDLQLIQSQIITFWQSKEELPETLAELEDDITGFIVPTDPETESSYGYRTTGELSFELCAVFARESLEKRLPEDVRFKANYEMSNWQHEAGRACFDREIDPDIASTILTPLRVPSLR